MYVGLMPPMYFNMEGEVVFQTKLNQRKKAKENRAKLMSIDDIMALDKLQIFGYFDNELTSMSKKIIAESKCVDAKYSSVQLLKQIELIGIHMTPRVANL